MSDKHKVPFGRPWITDQERDVVLDVLRGPILTHGPQCKGFEEEFAGFLGEGAHCVTVSSCMAALHLACLHFGIGPGDEVVVPAQTHAATAHCVELVGAKPVFVDCDRSTGNVTPDAIAAAITQRTKAIAVVHFVGIPCQMPEIMAVAERHGLKVIEDCALALGARYQGKHVGLFGDAGCFSFYPVKHITTGEGGMFVSRHQVVAEAVARLRAFGVDRSHSERFAPGVYDVPALGLNYRLSELQAALGRIQLMRITENLERRRSNFQALKDGLVSIPGIRILDSNEGAIASSYYCFSIVFQDGLGERRDEIAAQVNATGVGTSIYYPQPVPRMSYYRRKYGYEPARFPEAAEISDCSLSLPVAPHVSGEDLNYMVEKICGIFEEVNR